MRHVPTLLFVAYLVLDLSSPFVPGAFRFNPEECVEAAQRLLDTPDSHVRRNASSELRRPSVAADRALLRRAPTAGPGTAQRSHVAITHAAVDPPSPASADDH